MKINKKILKNFLFGFTLVVCVTSISLSIIYSIKKSKKPTYLVDEDVDVSLIKQGKEIAISSPDLNDVPIKLVEYQYNNKFFLGTNGLELLNQKIKSSLPYASEVFYLKSISINNQYSLPQNKNSINGSYSPRKMEINIDTRRYNSKEYFADATNINQILLEARVNFVYSVILHEYGHHLSNIYSTSIRYEDNLNYNQHTTNKIIEKGNNFEYYINTPFDFMQKWMDNLNYSNDRNNQRAINGGIYNAYSSKEYFDAANVINDQNYQSVKSSDQLFLVSKEVVKPIKSIERIFENVNRTLYYYSYNELFTRHLVTMNEISLCNKDENYRIYNLLTSIIDFSSIGYIDEYNSSFFDIASRNDYIVDENTNNIFQSTGNIMAADNIYGGTINNEITISNNSKNLYDAYQSLFGVGKLISQIYMDNSEQKSILDKNIYKTNLLSEKSFNRIRIGGYIPKNSTIKSLILFKTPNDYKTINLQTINSKGFRVKSALFDTYHSYFDDQNIPYISDQIDFNQLSNWNKYQLKYWDDLNANNIIDTQNEIKDIQLNQIVSNRPITSFRSSFKFYKTDGSTICYTDTINRNIWDLKWINNRITFSKTSN